MAVVIFALMVTGVVLFAMAFGSRRRAKKNNEPTGSLWWHLKCELCETAPLPAQKEQLKDNEKIERSNTRHDAMAELDATLRAHADSVSTAVSSNRNRREKKKKSRQRHPQVPVVSSASSSTGSILTKQVVAEQAISARKEADVPLATGALGTIRFTYFSDGGQTVREVDARGIDGTYLKGFCHLRQQIRTFRFDRIVGDITCLDTGEMMSPRAWKRHARQLAEAKKETSVPPKFARIRAAPAVPHTVMSGAWQQKSDGYVAVYFAGFRIDQRERLERMARAAGYKVRDALDAAVDVMVAGSMTGERQLRQAATFAVQIVDEDEFETMTADT
ncbi:NAD-dependent DNA ligase [Herbaspirillum rubrisubalbicans]|uniref:WYL domain-containing protein n=1 Tax=Herbaspirillum rubrisubalbicans TaxID=80842 RepID=UPI00209E060C|nr:WYL domain-containing protein [Herbaspirillum rubrisubalbicans]MCP1573640.1 NAD-dependent DNA ligase [Herbaspirillum rubrisubalbicans]